MNLFRELDLYKGLTLGIIILGLPAAGGWAWWLAGRIEVMERAVRDASKENGFLETIGTLQSQMALMSDRMGGESVSNAQTYFEGQILAAGNGKIGTEDFTIPGIKEQGGRTNKQEYVDKEVPIEFGGKQGKHDYFMPRDFLFAVLYNCESGARTGAGGKGAPLSVWKLRSLQIDNGTDEKLLNTHKTPPPELEDKWLVREMKFARREPKLTGK